MNTKFSQIESTDLYGVELVGKTAYICYLGDTSVYHAKYKDNDFVDSKVKFLEFISFRGHYRGLWSTFKRCSIDIGR